MIVAEYLENNWLWAKSDANDIAFEQKRGTEFVPNHYLESWRIKEALSESHIHWKIAKVYI